MLLIGLVLSAGCWQTARIEFDAWVLPEPIKAAVLEVPIEVPDCDELAAYGAALGAGSALGWWPRPGEGKSGDWPMPAVTTIEPEPLDVYREGLDRFIALGDEAVARFGRNHTID